MIESRARGSWEWTFKVSRRWRRWLTLIARLTGTLWPQRRRNEIRSHHVNILGAAGALKAPTGQENASRPLARFTSSLHLEQESYSDKKDTLGWGRERALQNSFDIGEKCKTDGAIVVSEEHRLWRRLARTTRQTRLWRPCGPTTTTTSVLRHSANDLPSFPIAGLAMARRPGSRLTSNAVSLGRRTQDPQDAALRTCIDDRDLD